MMFDQQTITGVRFTGIVLMFLAAGVVACSNRGRVRLGVYERARWLIFSASMLLGIHNVVQFLGQFRETSVTLCWAINLAFYVAITPLYNMGELYLLRAGRDMKSRMLHAVAFWIICYTILGVGFATDTLINDAAPWRTATFAVAVCYFLKIAEISRVLHRDMKVAYERLTDEELSERHQALHFTAKSMRWVIIFSFGTPWMGMLSSLLLHSLFGLIIFLLLAWYISQFVKYGNNITEVIGVNDELVEAEMIKAETTPTQSSPTLSMQEQDAGTTLSPEDAEKAASAPQPDGTGASQKATAGPPSPDAVSLEIKSRIELWVAARHYTDPNITIGDALKQMSVSATALNYYLELYTNVRGYRRWLPYLRIEESKRIMLEHPEYSLQAVAEACGYASKSSLSHAFKAQEFMPPAEWLYQQLHKEEDEA